MKRLAATERQDVERTGAKPSKFVMAFDSQPVSTQPAVDAARELSVLWTSAHPVVSAYLRANVHDFHRAEDLLQDTAAVLAEKFSEFDRSRPFLPWALGVARRELLHYLRTRSHDRHVFDEDAIQRITVAYAELSPRLVEMRAPLESCVKQLSGRPRKLLELRYIREMKPAMIASATGMTTNAVGVMLFRVRKLLQQCIERQLAANAHDLRGVQGGSK